MPWFPLSRQRPAPPPATTTASHRRPFFLLGGRRYRIDAPYMLPSDVNEVNRLDFQHYVLRYALRGNYAVPLRSPQSILDVGTGTGRWAVEMAQRFPSTNVVGVDNAPIPPLNMPQPANCVFMSGNVMQGLTFPRQMFAYVHQRLLIMGLPSASWPSAVQELARVTQPEGWVELIEGSWVRGGAGGIRQLGEWITRASANRGIDFIGTPARIGQFLQQAGLRNIVQREVVIPLGAKSGHVGQMQAQNLTAGLESLKNLIVAMQVTTPDDYDQAVTQARQEIAAGICEFPYYVAYGQKL